MGLPGWWFTSPSCCRTRAASAAPPAPAAAPPRSASEIANAARRARRLAHGVAAMAVRSKVLVLLLLQLVRPIIGLRFTVGDLPCGEQAGSAFGQLALRIWGMTRLPQASASLGQSTARAAALAGHTGLVSHRRPSRVPRGERRLGARHGGEAARRARGRERTLRSQPRPRRRGDSSCRRRSFHTRLRRPPLRCR